MAMPYFCCERKGSRQIDVDNAAISSALDLVPRALPVHTALRNCIRDEGGPFGFGNQVPIPSHRELLRSKALVVSVTETLGR